MRRFRRHLPSKWIVVVMILLFGMGIGYASLSQTLEIDGTSDIDSASWNVHFENVQVTTGSVTAATPTITDNTSVSFSATLENPGDFYEFTVDLVNSGTLNAKLDGLEVLPVLTSEQANYFHYSVTYSDGTAIQNLDALDAGTQEIILVRFEYLELDDTSLYPEDDMDFDFSVSMNYIQGNGNKVSHPSFANDSWEDVIHHILYNDIEGYYEIGLTKEIDMGTLGKHTVRLVNTSTPEECDTEGFSQSACGVVFEFVDILKTNKFGNSNTNTGGWEASALRTYLNSTAYNKFPDEIKNSIDSAEVISGHGSDDTNNFVTTDNVYIASPKEIGITYNYDSARTLTRTLDYYQTHNQTSDFIKYNSSSTATAYWTRAVPSNGNTYIRVISATGQTSNMAATTTTIGVAPLFKVALQGAS